MPSRVARRMVYLPSTFFFNPWSPARKKFGHRRARRVVVEIVRRLVAGVATVKPAIPLHLAAASGRGFDRERDRVGTDRQGVEIWVGHAIGIFERRRVVFIQPLLQSPTLAQSDLAFGACRVAALGLYAHDVGMPIRQTVELAGDRPDRFGIGRDDDQFIRP